MTAALVILSTLAAVLLLLRGQPGGGRQEQQDRRQGGQDHQGRRRQQPLEGAGPVGDRGQRSACLHATQEGSGQEEGGDEQEHVHRSEERRVGKEGRGRGQPSRG